MSKDSPAEPVVAIPPMQWRSIGLYFLLLGAVAVLLSWVSEVHLPELARDRKDVLLTWSIWIPASAVFLMIAEGLWINQRVREGAEIRTHPLQRPLLLMLVAAVIPLTLLAKHTQRERELRLAEMEMDATGTETAPVSRSGASQVKTDKGFLSELGARLRARDDGDMDERASAVARLGLGTGNRDAFATDEQLKAWLEQGLREKHPRVLATYARLQLTGDQDFAIERNVAAARQTLDELGHIDYGRGFAALAKYYHDQLREGLRASYTSGQAPESPAEARRLMHFYRKKAAEAGHREMAELYFYDKYLEDAGSLTAIRNEIAGLPIAGSFAPEQKELILSDFERNRPQIDARRSQRAEAEAQRKASEARQAQVARNSERVFRLIRDLDAIDFSFRAPPQPPGYNARVHAVNRYIDATRKWGDACLDHIDRKIHWSNQLEAEVFGDQRLTLTAEANSELNRMRAVLAQRIKDAQDWRNDRLQECDDWRYAWKDYQERAHFWRNLSN